MIRLLLLGCFLFSLILPLSAQTFYRQYGNSPQDEGGNAVIASPDGNMFVGGYKDDSALVMKLDLAGNILWSRAFKPVAGMPNTVYQLTISPDGYLIGVGNAFSATQGYYRDGFFFKIDMAGNLIWHNKISDTRPIICETILAKSITEYLITSNLYDMTAASYPDIIIYRINAANGTVISNSPRYDYISSNPYIDDNNSSTLNSDSTRLYTTGRIYIGGSAPSSMRPFLSKYDMNGAMLQTNYLCWNAAASARIYGLDLVYNSDSIAICYFGDKFGASSNFSVGLIRCDTAGNIAWSKDYNINISSSELCSKVLLTPTGYVIVGYTIGGGNDFFMIGTDFSGNLLWAKSYGGLGSTENFQLTYNPIATVIGNNIYLTGQSNSSGNKDIVLYATDLSGNITCMNVNNLTITVSNNPVVRTNLIPAQIPDIINFSASLPPFSQQPLYDVCSLQNLFLGNDTTICSPLSLNATMPGATSYLWQNGSTSPTLLASTPGTYWVTVEVNCCIYSDTINISGGSAPIAGFSSGGNPCTGLIIFTDSSSGINNYSWNFGDNTGSTLPSPNHQYTSQGTYVVTLVVSNQCGTDTAFTTISLPTPLIVTTNPSIVTVCAGDSVSFTAAASGGSGNLDYLWNPGNSTDSSITISPVSAGTFVVTVTDTAGCSTNDTVQYNVTTPVTLSATGTNTICAGLSTTIYANASNGGPYTWSQNLGSNDTVTVTPAATTTYYVSVFDSCQASWITDSVTIFVMPPTIVAFSFDSANGCAPLTVQFTDLSTTLQDQITGWTWYFGDGDSSHQVSPSHLYTTPGTYSVTLTVITSSGCVTTLINGGIINVYPVPVAGFDWEQTGATGDQPEVQFTDDSFGATSWFWLFGDSSTSTTTSPFHVYSSSGDYSAIQIVGNNYGCYDTAYMSMHLTGEFTLYIPNTFTPGTGLTNNTFGAIGAGITEYHMMVFDRWGMLIFESNDYATQWDGTFKGNPVQIDTYVYVIEAKDYIGVTHNFIGHVNVIR